MSGFSTREVRNIIRAKGFEQGVTHILETHNEQIRELRKAMLEQAQMTMHVIDSLNNVVNGTVAMKHHFEKAMKKAGLAEPEDDLDRNTHSL
jgi:hypothetical protein